MAGRPAQGNNILRRLVKTTVGGELIRRTVGGQRGGRLTRKITRRRSKR